MNNYYVEITLDSGDTFYRNCGDDVKRANKTIDRIYNLLRTGRLSLYSVRVFHNSICHNIF